MVEHICGMVSQGIGTISGLCGGHVVIFFGIEWNRNANVGTRNHLRRLRRM